MKLDGDSAGRIAAVRDDTDVQRWCTWCGPLMMALAGLGIFVIAPFLPPPDPRAGAEAISRLYIEDQNRIRIGMIVALVGGAFAFPFFTAVSKQMRRIENHWSSVAVIQLASGLLVCLLFSYPCLLWGVAAFRPEQRSAELTQLLNDLGWIVFVGFAMTVIVQFVVVGIAIFRDHREIPVYPRWMGYYCLWGAVLLAPGNLVLAFRHGPLSWNGIFALWIPLAVFGGWLVLMTYLTLKAISLQEHDRGTAAGRT